MSLLPGIYRHYKGNEYHVIAVARHSESGEDHVVYRALYGERGLWIRPLVMFTETVEREDGTLPRFEYQRPAESPCIG
ncbi:MAG: DUF1653 domain-containing protein [Spongiibacteraceae bacterium]